MKTVWMQVSRDRYELPVAVADTVESLAKMVHVSPNTIYKSRCISGEKSIYKKVDIEEGEDED